MTAPCTVFLQEKAPAAAIQENFDTATHPESGILRGYLVRTRFNLLAASNVTPTYEEWRDTILGSLFPLIQLFAPRYNNQLCTANLDGNFWAKLFEDHYGNCLPIEVANSPITYNNLVQITTSNKAVQVDFFIPFEMPALDSDRLWSCPPCSLFRGDVSLKTTWATTATVQSVALTASSVSFRWIALSDFGDNACVPIIHRFERRTYSQDSVDVGRGFPFFFTDNRAPSESIQYDVFRDGSSVNGSSMYGEDLMAAYRLSNKNIVPETSVYTPLRWVPQSTPVGKLEFAQRSVALKLTGASSGTFDLHFASPPGAEVVNALKAALGIDPTVKVATPPVAPQSAPLGNLNKKIAMNGPRTLYISSGQGLSAVGSANQTVPTVPAGTVGAAIAANLGR